jgi:23S rRNA (uracil1939-C5)-methyltransferase
MSAMKTTLKPGDIIECKLTSLEFGGYACVKHEEAILYVPRGVPGDEVCLRIKKLRKNFGSAEIQKIITPSEKRVDPKCEAFRRGCGGCQWLHIDYGTQLYWKARILGKMLTRGLQTKIGLAPVAGMKHPSAYRNKLSLFGGPGGKFGLMQENSKNLITFSQCPQEIPINQDVYAKLIRSPFPPSVTQLHLRGTRKKGCGLLMMSERTSSAVRKTAESLSKDIHALSSIAVKTRSGKKHLIGSPFLEEQIKGLSFRIPLDSFFQTNYTQAETLLTTAETLLAPTPRDKLVDLYCGVGFFTLGLARRAFKVVGIENNRDSVIAATLNARLNKIDNAIFTCEDVAAGLASFQKGEIDALLLDPPRPGCESAVLQEIIRIRPERIVYFSCAPDTLVRDIAFLTSRGYRFADCVSTDMFPHTYHIEAAVKLVAS